MSFWRPLTVFQSPACVARKIRRLRLRTFRCAHRQLTVFHSVRSHPEGTRSVCSCLHLTFPSVSSRLIVLRVTHHVHVSILSDRVLPYPAGYVFPLPFGRWPSLLGRSCPTRGLTFLTVGSPTYRPSPDSIGVSTFRTDEMRPRVPSGWGAVYTPGPWCLHQRYCGR
jgi:hypothetical protein